LDLVFDLFRLAGLGDRLLRDLVDAHESRALSDPSLARDLLTKAVKGGLDAALAERALAVFSGRVMPRLPDGALVPWEAAGSWILFQSRAGGLGARGLRLLWPVLGRMARRQKRGLVVPPFRQGVRAACLALGMDREDRDEAIRALAKRLKRAIRAAAVAEGLPVGLALRLDETGLLLVGGLDPATRTRVLARIDKGLEPIENRRLKRWIEQGQPPAPTPEREDPEPALPPLAFSRDVLDSIDAIEDRFLSLGVVTAVRVEVLGILVRRSSTLPEGAGPPAESSPATPSTLPEDTGPPAEEPLSTGSGSRVAFARERRPPDVLPGSRRRALRLLRRCLAPSLERRILPRHRAVSSKGGPARSTSAEVNDEA